MPGGSPTTINHLPDEILTRIFQSLPKDSKKTNRAVLLEVSRKFQYLADHSIGIDVFIGTTPWGTVGSDVPGVEHVTLEEIREIGVSTCHVGELLGVVPNGGGVWGFLTVFFDKVKSMIMGQEPAAFRHPHLLQSLKFTGMILNGFFTCLLTPETARWLRKLQLNHSSLSLLKPGCLQPFRFEHLELLEVLADFAYIFRDVDDAAIMSNTLTLLSNRFPRIQALKVYIPFTCRNEYEIITALFSFFHLNGRRLRFVEVCFFTMSLDEESSAPEVSSPEALTSLDRLTEKASEVINLQAVVLHINVVESKLSDYWTKLLRLQRGLQFYVVMSECGILSRSLVSRNAGSLRTLLTCVCTRGSSGESRPLDCAVVSDCRVLTHLTLRGRYEDFREMAAFAGLTSVKLLPMTLQHVEVSRIPVLTEDLQFILLSLPNLQYFVAKHVGKFGRMGVTLEIISEVVRERRIRWFQLLSSINGLMPVQGVSNGHPQAPQMLVAEHESFCVKLGAGGYYIMASVMEEVVNQLTMMVHRNNLA